MKEMETIKSLIAEQTRTIASQSQQIGLLTIEIEDLKSKLS